MYFNKPFVNLPSEPCINLFLQEEYDKINSREELIEFALNKIKDASNLEDGPTKQAIEFLAWPLYSFLTNKSFQSITTI